MANYQNTLTSIVRFRRKSLESRRDGISVEIEIIYRISPVGAASIERIVQNIAKYP